MKAYLSDTVLGVFILDESGEELHEELYKDIGEASEAISKLNIGVATATLERLLPKLGEYEIVFTDNPGISDVLKRKNLNVELMKPCSVIKNFRDSLSSFAVSKGYIKTREELDDFERSLLYELAKIGVKGVSARRDIYAAQMVRALDDMDKNLNLSSGRIREWFGLHFPELDKMVESHETYIKLIVEIGGRGNWTAETLKGIGIPDDKVDRLSVSAGNSIGAGISGEDLEMLQLFCRETLNLFKLRNDMSLRVDKVMEEVAPNLVSVVGSLISARLVSLAGGVENLAKMPASTIQVLGAEKALFRALKTGTRPPKHGIIFQFAAVHQSPRWQRGKIARALAAKAAIAARLDAYGGEFKGEELKADLERRIEEIGRIFKTPPITVKKRGRKRKSRGSRKI